MTISLMPPVTRPKNGWMPPSAQQKFAAAVSAIPDTATLSQAANSLRDEAATCRPHSATSRMTSSG